MLAQGADHQMVENEIEEKIKFSYDLGTKDASVTEEA